MSEPTGWRSVRMRLEGIAYLPEDGESPKDWDVPASLPLRVDFAGVPIGTARLTKHEDGTITAVADVVATPEWFRPELGRFAVGVASPTQDGRVLAVSLVEHNADPNVPPYTMRSEG